MSPRKKAAAPDPTDPFEDDAPAPKAKPKPSGPVSAVVTANNLFVPGSPTAVKKMQGETFEAPEAFVAAMEKAGRVERV